MGVWRRVGLAKAAEAMQAVEESIPQETRTHLQDKAGGEHEEDVEGATAEEGGRVHGRGAGYHEAQRGGRHGGDLCCVGGGKGEGRSVLGIFFVGACVVGGSVCVRGWGGWFCPLPPS